MINLSETEKAYLAGLFDGEGTIGYYLKKKIGYHIVQVAIYNTDPRIMNWIKERIHFGSITTNKRTKYIHWGWMISSKSQAVEFLGLIRSYLIIKADQVDLLLSFLNAEQKTRGSGNGKILSIDDITSRNKVENDLKLLKTANFESIH